MRPILCAADVVSPSPLPRSVSKRPAPLRQPRFPSFPQPPCPPSPRSSPCPEVSRTERRSILSHACSSRYLWPAWSCCSVCSWPSRQNAALPILCSGPPPPPAPVSHAPRSLALRSRPCACCVWSRDASSVQREGTRESVSDCYTIQDIHTLQGSVAFPRQHFPLG